MQTFLPYPSFYQSALALDNKRLGKQRVEALTILRVLNGEAKGWVNHPCVRMWRGFELSLARYGIIVCLVWRSRGFIDNTLVKIASELDKAETLHEGDPEWLGDERLHSSHRSNLLRKDYEYYSQFGWEEESDLAYYWPIK